MEQSLFLKILLLNDESLSNQETSKQLGFLRDFCICVYLLLFFYLREKWFVYIEETLVSYFKREAN